MVNEGQHKEKESSLYYKSLHGYTLPLSDATSHMKQNTTFHGKFCVSNK
jgi:hypothetical protein